MSISYQVIDQHADEDEPVIPVTFSTREEAEAWIAQRAAGDRYYIQIETEDRGTK
jgi:hypothetical protein